MVEIEPSGFADRGGVVGGVACAASPVSIPESTVDKGRAAEEEENECRSPSTEPSSTTEETSSIGKNSDLSATEGEEEDGENEVQSAYKGTFDSMDALEEVLPVRRGISKFYNGKSKSFTSLGEAATSSSSVKDIAKPENAYTRRRRNLLAFNHVWDRNKGFPHGSNIGGGISKRPILSSSKSTLALAVAMSSSESISSSSEDSISVKTPQSHLPPLHPRSRASHNNLASFHSPQKRDLSPWRSFSVVDLQQCAIAAANTATVAAISTNTTGH